MAYTNGSGQTRIGVRIVPLSVVIPTISALLDSYSGAAAAYSLRKLSATWSGSAIRVRRSSDNTEQDIGFDAGGNLDTIALSSFVGSGSGFVTTWYDQTGNNFNRTQTTAAAQPNIVYLGAINMVNGKPAMYFDGTGTTFALQGPKIGETYQGAGYSSTVLNVTKLDSSYSTTNEYPLFGGLGWYDSRFSINSNKWYLINTGTGISSTVNASANQVVSSVVFEYTTDKVRINGTEVISGNVGTNGGTDYNYIGRSYLGKFYQGYFQEHIIYASDKTSVISAMETNMNTYYSAYPNPTTVWNLLNAVYSADTTASPSLKTSLFAAYNGESNANDSFGSNNGTAVGGLTYGTGKIGNAFQFNGSNSYVSLPNNSLNSLTGNFSISMWVKWDRNNTSQILIANLNTNYGLGFFVEHTSGQLRFRGYKSEATNAFYVVKNSYTPTVGIWYHYTFTHKDQVNNIYENGVLIASDTTTTGHLNHGVTNWPTIGANKYNSTSIQEPFQGAIDMVNIWSKELTQSEITELYNSGNGAQYIGDNFYKPNTNDALGTNNGTAVGGLTYGLGKVGTAFQFNGTNAYVQLGDVMDIGTSSWSYSAWLNTSLSTTYQSIFTKTFQGGSTGRFHTYVSNNKIGYLFDTSNGLSHIIIETINTISINTWYNVVFVFDRSNNMRIYLNGTLQSVNSLQQANNLTLYSSTNFNTNHPFRIGCFTGTDNTSALSFFNGQIDELNIWNRVLTPTEITDLYNSGNGKQYPN